MFNYLLRGVFAAMAVKLLDNYRHLSVRFFKIEAAKSYLLGMQVVRNVTGSLMLMGLLIGLICFGVALFHASLFILLPWTMKSKAVLGMVLGLAYMVAGGVALRHCMDERRWMDKSGADAMLKEVTRSSTRVP